MATTKRSKKDEGEPRREENEIQEVLAAGVRVMATPVDEGNPSIKPVELGTNL